VPVLGYTGGSLPVPDRT